jgi:hypothetical protein
MIQARAPRDRPAAKSRRCSSRPATEPATASKGAGSAATNPAPAVAPAPLAAPSPPTINPAASPAHIRKIAVEAGDHAFGRWRSNRGGRGRGARREQKPCKPERNDGFLHDSSLPLRAMCRDDNTGIAPRALSCGRQRRVGTIDGHREGLCRLRRLAHGLPQPSYKAIAEAAAPSRGVRRTRARKASLPQRVLSTQRRPSGFAARTGEKREKAVLG